MDEKVPFLDLLDLSFSLKIDRQLLFFEIPFRERVVPDVFLGESNPFPCNGDDTVLSPRIFCSLSDEADTRDERIVLFPNPWCGLRVLLGACVEGDERCVDHGNRDEVARLPEISAKDGIGSLSSSLIPWRARIAVDGNRFVRKQIERIPRNRSRALRITSIDASSKGSADVGLHGIGPAVLVKDAIRNRDSLVCRFSTCPLNTT